MNIVIEKAMSNNAEELLKLNKEVWYQAYKDIVDKKTMDEHFERRLSKDGIERFSNYINKCQNFYMAVDKDKNKIIGYVDFGMCQWNEDYKDAGELYALYVLPSYQRNNIGQKMFDFAVNHFKSQKVDKLILTTFKQNSIGLGFYNKNNFIIAKEYPKGTWHDNKVDELLLLKNL